MQGTDCRFDGCPHPIRAKGLCRRHAEQARAGRPLSALDQTLPTDQVCSFGGCPFGAAAKGLCGGHAAQRRAGRELEPLRTVVPLSDTCSFDGCDRPRRSRGLCDGHNRVLRTEGKLRPLRHKARHGASLAERFEPHCGSTSPTPEGCWIWQKAHNDDGYGALHFTEPDTGRRRSLAHQAAWVLTHGPLPVGEELHHTCGRGAEGCCNPEHLQLVTRAENAAEMRARHAYIRRIAALEAQVEALTTEAAELRSENALLRGELAAAGKSDG